LERVRLGEMERDLVGGKSVVDLAHGVKLALNLLSVEGVEVDLDVLLSIKGNSGGLAGDCGRVALLLNIKIQLQ
jgi:hypothetical protein